MITTIFLSHFRECPLSLTAAYGLLNLGVKGAEVASLMQNGLDSAHGIEWLVYTCCRTVSFILSKYVMLTG